MNEAQHKRALAVISKIECDVERGVQHFDRSGKRLTEVSAIIAAGCMAG